MKKRQLRKLQGTREARIAYMVQAGGPWFSLRDALAFDARLRIIFDNTPSLGIVEVKLHKVSRRNLSFTMTSTGKVYPSAEPASPGLATPSGSGGFSFSQSVVIALTAEANKYRHLYGSEVAKSYGSALLQAAATIHVFENTSREDFLAAASEAYAASVTERARRRSGLRPDGSLFTSEGGA